MAAISYDPVAVLAEFSARRAITFPLLSDPGSATIKRYGIFNVTVPESNQQTYGIPFPGTFMLNAQRVVTARFFEPAYQERNTVASMLARLGNHINAPGTKVSSPQLEITSFTTDAVVAPGTHFSVVLDIRPTPRIHVYAPGVTGYKPIALTIESQRWVNVSASQYPRPEDYYFKPLDEHVQVYQRPFRIVQDIALDASPEAQAALKDVSALTLTGTLSYQACDDKICFNPQSVPLTWTVDVRQLDRERGRQSSAQTTGARPADAPPPGYLPPPLNPTGVVLETRRLSEGVYALLSNTPFADNAGFVVGAESVLVVDSGFNGRIGQQIIDAVKRVTGKPIRYLVNTNAFGDHIFGNYVFPRETRIIASRRTLDALRGTTIPEMAARMAPTVGGDLSVFAGVELRLADETFDEHWSVDLGGRRVEAHFFGAGMSPNDTVVYVPDAKVAWSGNLVFGDGTIPWAQSGGIATYRATLDRLSRELAIATIVPGHGALTTGAAITVDMQYLDEVEVLAKRAVGDKVSVNDFVSTATVPETFRIATPLVPLMTGFHRWNLQRAYREVVTPKP